jgi:hypothetical protein
VQDDDVYGDDESHPIPRVGVIDCTLALEGGGAYYGLVIASPMQSDERSRKRLDRKLQNYINDFLSEQSAKERGTPKIGKMRIYVGIHPASDPEIFSLIESWRERIERNSIELLITTKLDSFGLN